VKEMRGNVIYSCTCLLHARRHLQLAYVITDLCHVSFWPNPGQTAFWFSDARPYKHSLSHDRDKHVILCTDAFIDSEVADSFYDMSLLADLDHKWHYYHDR